MGENIVIRKQIFIWVITLIFISMACNALQPTNSNIESIDSEDINSIEESNQVEDQQNESSDIVENNSDSENEKVLFREPLVKIMGIGMNYNQELILNPIEDPPKPFLSVFMVNESEGWLTSGYEILSGSYCYHWNGEILIADGCGGYSSYSQDIWSDGDGNAWAVGIFANRFFPDENFGDWDVVIGNEENSMGEVPIFKSVWGFSEKDIWVSSVSNIYHWDGSKWTKMEAPSAFDDMFSTSSDDLWGKSGSALYRLNNGTWQKFSNSTVNKASAYSMISVNDGWAGGDYFYHWDGTNWTIQNELELFFEERVEQDTYDPKLYWAFDNCGGRYSWDNTQKTIQEELRSIIRGIQMVSSDLGWAYDYCGNIYQYDGESWELQWKANSNYEWNSISMVSDKFGWIAGQNGIREGIILEWDGSDWKIAYQFVEQEIPTEAQVYSFDEFSIEIPPGFLQANDESECYHEYLENNKLASDYLCYIAYFQYEENNYSETIYVNFSSTDYNLDRELSHQENVHTISVNNMDWIIGSREHYDERNKKSHLYINAYYDDDTRIWNIAFNIDYKSSKYDVSAYEEELIRILESFKLIL